MMSDKLENKSADSNSSLSTQHSKFSEAALEEAIIELLGKKGYPYVKGDTITREPGQVLLHADLRAFLAKQYADDDITPQEIETVINRLEAYSAADLYESNKAIMKLVCDGFLLKREDRSQKDLYIQLIDYSGLVAFREPEPGEVPSIVAEDEAIERVALTLPASQKGEYVDPTCQAAPNTLESFTKRPLNL